MIQRHRFSGVLACAAWALAVAAPPAAAWQWESDRVVLNDTFVTPTATSVSFRQAYSVPPVVVAHATSAGGDPAALRIDNVTATGFDIMAVEPPANDGPHVAMTVAYLAVQPGVHFLPDGRPVEAGFHTTATVQHGAGVAGAEGWDTVSLTAPFGVAPALVAALQTTRNEVANPPATASTPWLTTTVRNTGTNTFQVALERSESNAGSVSTTETVGYVALPGGASGTFLDNAGSPLTFETLKTAANIRGWSDGCFTNGFAQVYAAAPLTIASKNTHNGGDGGWLRQCSLTAGAIGLTVEEDIDRDSERNHTGEGADVAAFARPFDADLAPDLVVVKSHSVFADLTGGANPKAVPGALVDYTLRLSNQGDTIVDTQSLHITDPLPGNAALYVGDIGGPGSGPVMFVDGAPASGLALNFGGLAAPADDLFFSNDGAATFTYAPVADADGVDSTVTHIQIRPAGFMLADTGAGAPSFQLRLRVRID